MIQLHWYKRQRSYTAYAGSLRLVVKQKPMVRGGQWFVREVFGQQFFGLGPAAEFSEQVAAMQHAERLGARLLRRANKVLIPRKSRR